MLKKTRREKKKSKSENQAETLIYETEKNMKELEDPLCLKRRRTISTAAKDDHSPSALEASNIDDIKAKTEALTEKFHTISAKMYQQAQAAGAAGADPSMEQQALPAQVRQMQEQQPDG